MIKSATSAKSTRDREAAAGPGPDSVAWASKKVVAFNIVSRAPSIACSKYRPSVQRLVASSKPAQESDPIDIDPPLPLLHLIEMK